MIFMKEKNIFFKMIGYLLSLLIFAYILATCLLYLSCFYASHQLPENFEHEYLRIKIYGSSVSAEGNTVSATFSIIDSNGNEIATIERSWSGAYLAVEFVQADFNDKYYLFPSKIYGKNRIIEDRKERKKGISLEKYYDDYGQCMLLGFGSSLKERKALYKIAAFATHKYHLPTFGLTSRYTIDLSECKTNHYYSIACDENGKLVVKEL